MYKTLYTYSLKITIYQWCKTSGSFLMTCSYYKSIPALITHLYNKYFIIMHLLYLLSFFAWTKAFNGSMWPEFLHQLPIWWMILNKFWSVKVILTGYYNYKKNYNNTILHHYWANNGLTLIHLWILRLILYRIICCQVRQGFPEAWYKLSLLHSKRLLIINNGFIQRIRPFKHL